ncbi:hypothetical protein BU16DRAFT_617404 [Lophium mytilinum]|uniref:Lysine-specific metallo-endopeptidase domain-containing protein n=1 Tax=Lophium mytilinum TaxID=390894 RepID=A0A6A6QUL3_9PEZI|nr:hypothetical protein BU16DRAFT_617404 [Lophium mytilinum]
MNRFSDYKDQVTANIDRLAKFRTGWLTTWTLRVRCDDKLKQCPEKEDPPDDPCDPPGDGDPTPKKPTKIAYVATVDPYIDHMFFCPSFFLRPKLDDRIATTVNNLVQANWLDNYANRATTVAHELLHISWIGSPIDSPARNQLIDIFMPDGNWKAYRTVDCKYLAHSEIEPDVQHVNNVNNYMWWFLANYIIHKYDFYPSGSTWLTTLDPPLSPPSVANLAITNSTDVEIGWGDC